MKGLFITFEGNDGSGKSSVIKAVSKDLVEQGYEIVLTREPGGSKIAEKIRTIILDVDNIEMDCRTEALLYAASRREHLIQTVIPALKQGKIVLSDRFIDSSLVYQGLARGIGIDKIYEMNLFAVEEWMPDLTIMITVKPEIGMDRIKHNRQSLDRLEIEKLDFHYKVYEGYQQIASKYPQRIKMINGEASKEEVIEKVKAIINEYVNERMTYDN